MEKTTFIKLINSYLQGSATLTEQQLLDAYYQKLQRNNFTDLSIEQEKALKELMFNNIMKGITRPVKIQKRVVKLWPRIAVAAAVLLIIGISLFYYANTLYHSYPEGNPALVKNDVSPGKNRATLTFANGSTVLLSEAKSGILVGAKQLLYNDSTQINQSEANNKFSALGPNTIQTPRGGTYQITLPDGTKVWLNAASTLRFPSNFKELGNRKVELSGEAYFEVAKDKAHPFIVSSVWQEVEVKGTHFNISAYKDDHNVKTTLLEGSVLIHLMPSGQNKNMAQRMLKPGQQSQIRGDAIVVEEVETEDAIAWKSGYFMFNNESLESAMIRVGRWYNVNVVYEDEEAKKGSYFGKVSRYEDLSKVLRLLSKTDLVKFKIEGNTIRISKN